MIKSVDTLREEFQCANTLLNELRETRDHLAKTGLEAVFNVEALESVYNELSDLTELLRAQEGVVQEKSRNVRYSPCFLTLKKK
jgi:hypothetical protein